MKSKFAPYDRKRDRGEVRRADVSVSHLSTTLTLTISESREFPRTFSVLALI